MGDPANVGAAPSLKEALAEEGLPCQDADGDRVRVTLACEDPMGQPYKETRTDGGTVSGDSKRTSSLSRSSATRPRPLEKMANERLQDRSARYRHRRVTKDKSRTMSEMINFGIDLGATNSLIAKFTKGTVEVFKDPRHQGTEVLPSVVGFRNNRILVGQQAKAFIENDPQSVASQFKRKIGTTETFRIKSLGQSKTPIELSAFALKELKTFIHTGEAPEAVVITVPASFDMVQSNATKEAGRAAGFKQVVLLQEPIAASLAYANTEKSRDLKNSQWIVYDLGGGTFGRGTVKKVVRRTKIGKP